MWHAPYRRPETPMARNPKSNLFLNVLLALGLVSLVSFLNHRTSYPRHSSVLSQLVRIEPMPKSISHTHRGSFSLWFTDGAMEQSEHLKAATTDHLSQKPIKTRWHLLVPSWGTGIPLISSCFWLKCEIQLRKKQSEQHWAKSLHTDKDLSWG